MIFTRFIRWSSNDFHVLAHAMMKLLRHCCRLLWLAVIFSLRRT